MDRRRHVIQKFAQHLQHETSEFLENHVEIHKGRRQPNLPIFFVKTFNFLKAEARAHALENRFLDFIPLGIHMQLLTEFGPPEDFPKATEHGLEDSKEATSSLAQEIRQFYADIIDYVRNAYTCTARIPALPHAFFITLVTFQRRVFGGGEEGNEENRELVENIPGNMQTFLAGIIGNAIRDDYVLAGYKRHYAVMMSH